MSIFLEPVTKCLACRYRHSPRLTCAQAKEWVDRLRTVEQAVEEANERDRELEPPQSPLTEERIREIVREELERVIGFSGN